jgi:hypothetical protein
MSVEEATANQGVYIPLAEAAKLLPIPTNPETIRRWTVKGVNGKRLRSISIVGRRFVHRDDILSLVVYAD